MSIKANEDPRSKRELLEKIDQLCSRLDEAEQTLDAIRSGDVDALVVAGPHGDQVFSLSGAERTYRLIVETMNEAALTVALDETILFCNARFCDLVKVPMSNTTGQKLSAFFAPAQHHLLRMLMDTAQAGSVKQRLMLRAADGARVSVQIAASLLVADGLISICMVATDLTELEAQTNSIRVMREQQQSLEETSADLQREIMERRRAEEELQKAHIELELRVRERTGELSKANKKLTHEIEERKKAEGSLQGTYAEIKHLKD